MNKLTSEKDDFTWIPSPVFAIWSVTLWNMLLDYIYPTEIAGPLHGGPAAFLSESICGLLNLNHILDLPDPCLPVEIAGDQAGSLLCPGHIIQ